MNINFSWFASVWKSENMVVILPKSMSLSVVNRSQFIRKWTLSSRTPHLGHSLSVMGVRGLVCLPLSISWLCELDRNFEITFLNLKSSTRHKYDNAIHNDCIIHYSGVIIGTMSSQITSLTIVYSIVYSGVVQRKHQSSASLIFVRGIHRGPVNSPRKWSVTQKMFPFYDVIMLEKSLDTLSVKQHTTVDADYTF